MLEAYFELLLAAIMHLISFTRVPLEEVKEFFEGKANQAGSIVSILIVIIYLFAPLYIYIKAKKMHNNKVSMKAAKESVLFEE